MTPQEKKKDVEVKTQEMRASPEGNILKPGVRQINVAERLRCLSISTELKSLNLQISEEKTWQNLKIFPLRSEELTLNVLSCDDLDMCE